MITPAAFIDPLESLNTYLVSLSHFAPSSVEIVPPSIELLTTQRYPDDTLRLLERAMRTADKSEIAMGPSSHTDIVSQALAPQGPTGWDCEAALDHVNLSFRVKASHQVIQELVQFRPAIHTQAAPAQVALTQQPARAVLPWHLLARSNSEAAQFWKQSIEQAFSNCAAALERFQWSSGEAHGLRPTDAVAEVVSSMSLRAWREFLRTRTSPDAHPDMQIVAREMLRLVMTRLPLVFQDIQAQVNRNIGEKDTWLEQNESEVAARHQSTYRQWRTPIPVTPKPGECNPKLDRSKDFWVPYAEAKNRPDFAEDWTMQHVAGLIAEAPQKGKLPSAD